MGFNEFDFVGGETVLLVQLEVDVVDGFRPVDI